MKRFFLFLALILMSTTFPLTAHAADAASFDPTLVKVTAKPISSIPVGTIISWPVAQNPADWQNPDGSYNWLECNGQTISQAAYPELFALLGGRVPDLRGLFLRGYGSQSHAQQNGSTVGVTSTTHTSGELGKVQGDAMRKISGSLGEMLHTDRLSKVFAEVYYTGQRTYMDGTWRSGHVDLDSSFVTPTANEVRPANLAVRYLIRSKP